MNRDLPASTAPLPAPMVPGSVPTIHIAILGCGTVGRGLYQLLCEQRERIRETVGVDPVVRHILVRDASRPRDGIEPSLLTDDWKKIISDPQVEVVVELIGGRDTAYMHIREALMRGRHVVTANKDLMATRGSELLTLAALKKVKLLFEAAVGGAIPILRAVRESLSGDQVLSIQGIINGTTNHIITQMSEQGVTFGAALREAQAAGYAEADPANDVDGVDAAYKLAVLASLAFHTSVSMRAVDHEGIRNIDSIDIEHARSLGYCVKLVAEARDHDDQLELLVAPTLLPLDHPLAGVRGSFNAVLLRTAWAGELMFYGRGAGERPTASAAAGDVIEVLHHLRQGHLATLPFPAPTRRKIRLGAQRATRYYVRLRVADQPGALASISRVLAREQISLQCILQKGKDSATRVDVVLVTHETTEQRMQRAVKSFEKLTAVHSVAAMLRVRGAVQ